MIWRIGQFPELEHLDAEDRRAVLRNVRWWVYPLLLLRAFTCAVLAMVGLGLMSVLLFGIWDMPVPAIPTGLLTLIFLVIAYLYQINSVRRTMRAEIRELVARCGSPLCLSCGYDVRGSPGSRCPECGAPIVGR